MSPMVMDVTQIIKKLYAFLAILLQLVEGENKWAQKSKIMQNTENAEMGKENVKVMLYNPF